MDPLFPNEHSDESDESTGRTDADPPMGDAAAPAPPPVADAPALEVVSAVPVDIATALADFAAEDAEILKTLSPEGLALLASMARQKVAEAAEQAVMAGGDIDASAAAKAKESIGETMEGAAKAAESDVVEDATVPAAPQALTADAVQAMIDAAMAKVAAPKKDAAKIVDNSRLPGNNPVGRPVVDQVAVARKIAESRRFDAEFVGVARKDGHVGETASIKDAATAMFGVIVAHTPKLAPLAKDAIVNGRRDAFLQIYAQAEDIRRDTLIDDQSAIFASFGHAPDDTAGSPSDLAAALAGLGRPASVA
jgi:hypothetical protein